jgi:dolichyl-phosphate mannosyltransferase polypeptide 3
MLFLFFYIYFFIFLCREEFRSIISLNIHMKHIVKLLALLVAISAFWIGLLETTVIPRSYAWLVRTENFILYYLSSGSRHVVVFNFFLDLIICLILFTFQLPVYFIVSLGCYGLLMVGIGLMHFPTCPQEAGLLQQVLNPFPLYYLSFGYW